MHCRCDVPCLSQVRLTNYSTPFSSLKPTKFPFSLTKYFGLLLPSIPTEFNEETNRRNKNQTTRGIQQFNQRNFTMFLTNFTLHLSIYSKLLNLKKLGSMWTNPTWKHLTYFYRDHHRWNPLELLGVLGKTIIFCPLSFFSILFSNPLSVNVVFQNLPKA